MTTLTAAEIDLLGGPDGPWIRDEWDGLLAAVEAILATREADLREQIAVEIEKDRAVSVLNGGFPATSAALTANNRAARIARGGVS